MRLSTATVTRLYPDLGCIQVRLDHPAPLTLDFVPVLQPIRGIYSLPGEEETVVVMEVNGGAMFVCIGRMPSLAYKAGLYKHSMINNEDAQVDFADRTREHTVINGDEVVWNGDWE